MKSQRGPAVQFAGRHLGDIYSDLVRGFELLAASGARSVVDERAQAAASHLDVP
jgi:hypothetical protein